MLYGFKTFVLITFCSERTFVKYVVGEEPTPCFNRFEYEYHVLEKLLSLTEKAIKQEDLINKLTKKLNDAEATIQALDQSLVSKELSASTSSYVRWGRTTCPDGAVLVYEGYAAGNFYTHSGSGANRLCLPTDPVWGDYVDGFQTADRLYGGEYETSSYSKHSALHDNDVPCVVCRIPRSNVLMIPGRNICYDDYVLEYSGYLMSGHYSHTGPSEYVCVDGEPESLRGGGAGTDGNLFYFVESTCHALKCPPYASGREVTCAVCSYSPK